MKYSSKHQLLSVLLESTVYVVLSLNPRKINEDSEEVKHALRAMRHYRLAKYNNIYLFSFKLKDFFLQEKYEKKM